MKLAIISSQLHGSGNQNPEWKRKLKTFQKHLQKNASIPAAC